MFPSFPFGFEGGIWDLSEFIPKHCLSIYIDPSRSAEYKDTQTYVSFVQQNNKKKAAKK